MRVSRGTRFGAPVVPEVSISIATAGSPFTASVVPRARMTTASASRLQPVAPSSATVWLNTSSDHSADGASTKDACAAARSALSRSGGCSGLMVTSVRPPRKIAMSAATDSIRLPSTTATRPPVAHPAAVNSRSICSVSERTDPHVAQRPSDCTMRASSSASQSRPSASWMLVIVTFRIGSRAKACYLNLEDMVY